jgi:hypothetical protein
MEKITNLFREMINAALDSADKITGTDMYYKKAVIYSELAKALALTEQVDYSSETTENVNEEETVAKGSEDKARDPNYDSTTGTINKLKTKESKDSLKKKTTSKTNDVKEEKEEVKKNEELTDEWNDYSRNLFKEELEKISEHKDFLGEKLLNGFVSEYTEGIFKTVDEGINPLNVKGFCAYLDSFKDYIDILKYINNNYDNGIEQCVVNAYSGKINKLEDVPVDHFVAFVKLCQSYIDESNESSQN